MNDSGGCTICVVRLSFFRVASRIQQQKKKWNGDHINHTPSTPPSEHPIITANILHHFILIVSWDYFLSLRQSSFCFSYGIVAEDVASIQVDLRGPYHHCYRSWPRTIIKRNTNGYKRHLPILSKSDGVTKCTFPFIPFILNEWRILLPRHWNWSTIGLRFRWRSFCYFMTRWASRSHPLYLCLLDNSLSISLTDTIATQIRAISSLLTSRKDLKKSWRYRLQTLKRFVKCSTFYITASQHRVTKKRAPCRYAVYFFACSMMLR